MLFPLSCKSSLSRDNWYEMVGTANMLCIGWGLSDINPYHTEGNWQFLSTSAKCDYNLVCSNSTSTPSGTIVFNCTLGSKIDSRRCYPLFIILYLFLRWGHLFWVYIVPVLSNTEKKLKMKSWANKNSSLDSIFKGPDYFDH